jgi:hypothetical protein
MSMEGPPEVPEKKEKEPITDEQCVEAMKAGNFETVQEWRAQQEKITNLFDHESRLNLERRYADLQIKSGLIDEETGESYAIPTLEAVRDAYPAQRDQQAWEIQDLIDQLRKK